MWEGAVGLGTRLTDEDRARIAELAATRLPSRLIAKEVGRSHRAVWSYVHKLRRPVPAERRRSPLRLSLTEREEISRGVAGGESFRAIAGRLGRAPSTISREVAINGGRRRYRACRADTDALARARRPKAAKLATCERLRAVVEARLEKRWSPQQIAGWLPTAFPGDTEMRVSHETIYLSLYVQTRGALRKELTATCDADIPPGDPAATRSPTARASCEARCTSANVPPKPRTGPVPGHWEGDLLYGKRMTAIATLVERHSRFVMLVELPNGHSADVVADALARHITTLPEQLARLQRKHQRTATPILPQTQRPRPLLPTRARHRRRRTQRTPSTNPRLDDTLPSTRPSVAMTP
jgi:IS30 family transposase